VAPTRPGPRRRYAPPHPAGTWPLAANILDPVRLSVVVRGPARMLEVARWLSEEGAGPGRMPVLRAKNLFALPSHAVRVRARGGERAAVCAVSDTHTTPSAREPPIAQCACRLVVAQSPRTALPTQRSRTGANSC
jgi:hypothetical protein